VVFTHVVAGSRMNGRDTILREFSMLFISRDYPRDGKKNEIKVQHTCEDSLPEK
jgi:hypothetical protein